MPALPSVYISYRYSSSAEIAEQLHHLLRERRLDVFFDRDLPLGTDFTVELPRQLAARDVLVVLLANDTHLSVNGVLPEIRQALDQGKRIIPVILPGFDIARDSHGTVIAQLAPIFGVRYNPRNPEGAADAITQALTVTVQQGGGGMVVTVKTATTPPASVPLSPPSSPPSASGGQGGMSDGLKIAIIAGIFALLAAIAPLLIERLFPATSAPTAIVQPTVISTPLPPTPGATP